MAQREDENPADHGEDQNQPSNLNWDTWLKAKIQNWLGVFRLAFISLISVLVVLGLIHNFFAPEEKDIPDHEFQMLYNLFQTNSFPPISALNHQFQLDNSEWITKNQSKP